MAQLDLEKPEFKQNADDEIAEYLTMSDEAGDEIRRLKPELAELEEEVRPNLAADGRHCWQSWPCFFIDSTDHGLEHSNR